ncbi:MAG: septum formation protein Maf [Deltaproteobacteria bacterium]|nr:septum formation protein Maf [Deltaproteobacteria bacterium]
MTKKATTPHKQHPYRLILASQSPRRKKLLRHLLQNIDTSVRNFDIIPADIDETRFKNESALQYTRRMALEKGLAVSSRLPPSPPDAGTSHKTVILSADTIVVLGKTIYPKPKDHKHAAQILTALSGKVHRVITAYALVIIRSGERQRVITRTGHDTSRVHFYHLTKKQITDYSCKKEPMDKAGAYAVQGAGRAFIHSIEGSYHNVMGLPTEKIGPLLEKILNSRQ